MRARWWVGIAVLLVLVACDKKQAGYTGVPPAAMINAPSQGMRAPPGTSLAYEHDVTIKIAGRDIPAHVAATQASCLAQTFGDCAVLEMSQRGGDYPGGSVTVRIAPKGVDPLIRQAGTGGDIGNRSTKAEDLADAVQDNALQRDRLEKEHARLLEFEARPNLAVADMLALSKQLADVESALDAAKREGAQQQHRIDTNLLTISFEPTATESGRSDIGQAFSDFGQIIAGSTAWLIRAIAVLIPLFAVFFVLGLLWRWRKRMRAGK